MKFPILGRNRGLHDLQIFFKEDDGSGESGVDNTATDTTTDKEPKGSTEPGPIDPAPEPQAQPQVLDALAQVLGFEPEELKAVLSKLKPTATPEAKPNDKPADKPEADTQRADKEAEKPEDKEAPELSPAELRTRALEVLEAARDEAEALGLTFHKGALKTLAAAGAFNGATFDAQGKPTDVRQIVERIAQENPWAVHKPRALDTGARDNGRSSSVVSEADIEAAKRKYGIG